MSLEIWILERPQNPDLALQLAGNFSIRAFASFDAFWLICSILPNLNVDGIVINKMQFGDLFATAVRKTVSLRGIEIPIFHLDGTNSSNNHELNNTLNVPFMPLHLRIIQNLGLYRTQKKCPHSYRNRFILDQEQLTCINVESKSFANLTVKELKILNYLFRMPDHKATREELRQSVWPDVHVGVRTIDSHISRLRKKLEPMNLYIDTHYKDGYALTCDK